VVGGVATISLVCWDGATREAEMRIVGAMLILLGLLLCLSIVGAIVGIPMILIGAVLVAIGGRRKVVITNTVTVANTMPVATRSPVDDAPLRSVRPAERLPPSFSSSTASLPPPSESFDRKRWLSLVRYDDELRTAAETVRPYGQKWEDELAEEYLQINDKAYLSKIVERIVSEAKVQG
jgi:hypothetical protein